MNRTAALLAALTLAGLAASCGHRAALERPEPMWGRGDRAPTPGDQRRPQDDENNDPNPAAPSPL